MSETKSITIQSGANGAFANLLAGEGQIEVPNEFTIVVAPFVGSAPVAITARLRFRITDGHLGFIYKLNQPQKVLENAFDSARSYIAHRTELPVLLGSACVGTTPS